MARRALKPLTPLLVALVAVVLGFLAIGSSFAGSVAPADGQIPASTTSVPRAMNCASCMSPTN